MLSIHNSMTAPQAIPYTVFFYQKNMVPDVIPP